MASAWGGSWGYSWGASWGLTGVQPVVPPPVLFHTTPGESKRKRRNDDEFVVTEVAKKPRRGTITLAQMVDNALKDESFEELKSQAELF